MTVDTDIADLQRCIMIALKNHGEGKMHLVKVGLHVLWEKATKLSIKTKESHPTLSKKSFQMRQYVEQHEKDAAPDPALRDLLNMIRQLNNAKTLDDYNRKNAQKRLFI